MLHHLYIIHHTLTYILYYIYLNLVFVHTYERVKVLCPHLPRPVNHNLKKYKIITRIMYTFCSSICGEIPLKRTWGNLYFIIIHHRFACCGFYGLGFEWRLCGFAAGDGVGMPKPKRKAAGKRAEKATSRKGVKTGQEEGQEGQKGKRGKEEEEEEEEEEVEVNPPLLDPYAVYSMPAAAVVPRYRARKLARGPARNVVLDSLLPPLRFWSHLREIRMWGHNADKETAVVVTCKQMMKIDTLCLRSNDLVDEPTAETDNHRRGEAPSEDAEGVPEAEQVTLQMK